MDKELLVSLDLGGLDVPSSNLMLGLIYETLEMRVGMQLAEKMTNEELDEFEAFINDDDEAGALQWLETNFPDYKELVSNQLDLLKREIADDADLIVDVLVSDDS